VLKKPREATLTFNFNNPEERSCYILSCGSLQSHTLSLLSSLTVSDQVSHPHKTTSKITVLYILNLIFLDRKLENKSYCTEYQQAIPDFNLPLISQRMEFLIRQICSQIFELFHPFK
jgi:hypothetical protein